MKTKWILASTILLVANFLAATELLNAPGEVFIYNRQSKEWTFPAVTKDGRVTVDFYHRIDYPRAAGWNPCWQIEVNGKFLTSKGNRKTSRLLNKPATWYHKWHGNYSVDNKSDKWYALYAPDYHSVAKNFSPEHKEATHVILDISDVVKKDAPNVIKIRFGGVSEGYYRVQKVLDRKPALAVKGFKVSQSLVPSPLKVREEKLERAVMKPRKDPRFDLVREKKQLIVVNQGVRIPVISRFTVPGGQWIELGDKNSIATPYYKITRKIVKHANRLDFFDTVTSTSDKLIGLKFRNGTHLANFDPVYVAGDSNPSADEFATGRNPSVFGAIPAKNAGVAFLAVDDVSRVQNISRCSDQFFSIGSDNYALSPGESRTIEWSLYPVNSAEYFDFVNEVRRGWKVNFPIQGSFNLSMNVYAKWNKKDAQRNVRNMGLYFNTFGSHFWNHMWRQDAKYKNYSDNIWGIGREGKAVRVRMTDKSVHVLDPAPMNEFEKMCIARCRAYTPDIKILTYIHNQICVAADDEKYEESRLYDEKGRKRYYNGGEHQKLFVPTGDNAFGKQFLHLIDWNIKNFDLDGIYWDEINHTNTRIYGGKTMWDTVSVKLDDKFHVKQKISFVPLLKLPLTLKAMEKILVEHKKLLVGNFSPETRSELQYQFPRFEETYSTRWIALSHLYTPIQLGDMLTYANTPIDMAKDMRNALFRGALYYHYLGSTGCPSLTSKMFPFTPVELHSGYLIGKERILSAISGDFGWYGENRLAQIFVFDEYGREVPSYPAEIIGTDAGTRIKLELKKDHCAAMVAIPVTADLDGVTLEQISYENGKLFCLAKGKGKVAFRSVERSQIFTVDGTVKLQF